MALGVLSSLVAIVALSLGGSGLWLLMPSMTGIPLYVSVAILFSVSTRLPT
jgi:hypothetical protein